MLVEGLFRIRFPDGGLDGGSHTGYMIRNYRNGSWWNISVKENDDPIFYMALDDYKKELLQYWSKNAVVNVAPDGKRGTAMYPAQYTATITQPLWQNVYDRIVNINKDIRLGTVSNETIQREIGVRLALLHVDPSLINRILNEETRLNTLSELSAERETYAEYVNGKIVERHFKRWTKDYMEKYGTPVDCPLIDNSLPFRDSVPVEEIQQVEQETGYRFYYIIPHAGRMYGLYVNPAHPDTWAGDRRALNSGNYEKLLGLKPILRLFSVENSKVKHVFLPLCNCMGKIKINTWDTRMYGIF